MRKTDAQKTKMLIKWVKLKQECKHYWVCWGAVMVVEELLKCSFMRRGCSSSATASRMGLGPETEPCGTPIWMGINMLEWDKLEGDLVWIVLLKHISGFPHVSATVATSHALDSSGDVKDGWVKWPKDELNPIKGVQVRNETKDNQWKRKKKNSINRIFFITFEKKKKKELTFSLSLGWF